MMYTQSVIIFLFSICLCTCDSNNKDRNVKVNGNNSDTISGTQSPFVFSIGNELVKVKSSTNIDVIYIELDLIIRSIDPKELELPLLINNVEQIEIIPLQLDSNSSYKSYSHGFSTYIGELIKVNFRRISDSVSLKFAILDMFSTVSNQYNGFEDYYSFRVNYKWDNKFWTQIIRTNKASRKIETRHYPLSYIEKHYLWSRRVRPK